MAMADSDNMSKNDVRLVYGELAVEAWNLFFNYDVNNEKNKSQLEILVKTRLEQIRPLIAEKYQKSINIIIKRNRDNGKNKAGASEREVAKECYNGYTSINCLKEKLLILCGLKYDKGCIFFGMSKDVIKLIFFWLDYLVVSELIVVGYFK